MTGMDLQILTTQFHADELPTKAGIDRLDKLRFRDFLRDVYEQDYPLVNAPIRLFIFDNRIEIISPGHLPNNLTVEKIRTGNANIRNPVLVSYVAKGLLPYHGLGSGIKRALDQWPDIEFVDDREGCLFTAIVNRKTLNIHGGSVINSA